MDRVGEGRRRVASLYAELSGALELETGRRERPLALAASLLGFALGLALALRLPGGRRANEPASGAASGAAPESRS